MYGKLRDEMTGELSNIPLKELPFYTREDTMAGGRRHYGEIAARFIHASPLDLQQMVYLIDTIDQMDPQIYEYYRNLQDLFRENIHRFLSGIRLPQGGYRAESAEQKQMLIDCLQKACANKTLLGEKYQDLPVIL